MNNNNYKLMCCLIKNQFDLFILKTFYLQLLCVFNLECSICFEHLFGAKNQLPVSNEENSLKTSVHAGFQLRTPLSVQRSEKRKNVTMWKFCQPSRVSLRQQKDPKCIHF